MSSFSADVGVMLVQLREGIRDTTERLRIVGNVGQVYLSHSTGLRDWFSRLVSIIITMVICSERTMKNLFATLAILIAPLLAQAGVYYSGESYAELPSQWRGVLVDQRGLGSVAIPPAKGLPQSPLQKDYRDALARLEKKETLSADELADLGALYIRLGQPAKAVERLRPAQRQHPEHFRIAAN